MQKLLQTQALRRDFEDVFLRHVGIGMAKHLNGTYEDPRAELIWRGWVAARNSVVLPSARFHLVPATTPVEFHGMRVCPTDAGQPSYDLNELKNALGIGKTWLLPNLYELGTAPFPMLEAFGRIASLVMLRLPAPCCYVRPAATLPALGGYQVWENDGTATPAYTRNQVLSALIPPDAEELGDGPSSIAAVIEQQLVVMHSQGLRSPKEISERNSAGFAASVAQLCTGMLRGKATVQSERRYRLYDTHGRMLRKWDWDLLRSAFGIVDCQPFSQAVLDGVDFQNYTWVELNGLHYDAETPEGVSNFFELPYMQRMIDAQRNVLPYQQVKK